MPYSEVFRQLDKETLSHIIFVSMCVGPYIIVPLLMSLNQIKENLGYPVKGPSSNQQ